MVFGRPKNICSRDGINPPGAKKDDRGGKICSGRGGMCSGGKTWLPGPEILCRTTWPGSPGHGAVKNVHAAWRNVGFGETGPKQGPGAKKHGPGPEILCRTTWSGATGHGAVKNVHAAWPNVPAAWPNVVFGECACLRGAGKRTGWQPPAAPSHGAKNRARGHRFCAARHGGIGWFGNPTHG